MSANLIIIQLLHTQSNHAEFLRLCWENLSDVQKKEIFYFLYNCKQYRTFLTILRTELNRENPYVPWTHMFAILENLNKLTPTNLRNFLTCQPREEMGVFRLHTPELQELWNQRKKKVLEEHESKKTELLKNLEFAKHQGIKDQRNKVLSELKKLFPRDKQVASAFHEEKEFRARNTLNKISSKHNQSGQINIRREKSDPAIVESFTDVAMTTVANNPRLTLDMAILFFQMELYTESLKIIDTIKKKSSRVLWHELYISIEGKQFARALSVISQLKGKKDIDSEKSFSLLYFQALALHGLGKMSEARKIIKNIVKIRPHFKSATSLLLEWESDK